MTISNHERVGRALTLLKQGLYPFVERELKALHGDRWTLAASAVLPEHYIRNRKVPDVLQEDLSSLLIVVWELWNQVFKNILGRSERNLISELRDTRNEWAHKTTWSTDDTYRALDSMARLLSAFSAPEADEVEKQRQELLRQRFDEQARRETRRATPAVTQGETQAGLKPWREIVTPHPDVASGRYQQAEFAADLWQVYLDQGSDEYRDPTEFFSRTYLTEGLRQLLCNALLRLSGKGGDPVIELQTNFGGGKTHSMLALFHLCLGVPADKLPGLETIFASTGIAQPPANVNTVVLVGNKISPGQPQIKSDGTIVRTLWGEIAWQLGGKEAYEMIRQSDETSTNPGDILKDVFNRYSPCLILVDEWVAYARQLHEESDLPGGSFDTHFTFAQTLSESAKNADRTLLVASIPASDIETGGDRGKQALDRLKNAIGRVESPWRPASAEESFEIVRRRLFQPIAGKENFTARDAVVRGFSELYKTQASEFPSECREADYKRRIESAYPIHPELFDRLYSDWSSLDKFQRTRGVLRLMAKVIHSLWERNDQSLVIMPAHIAIDDSQVQSELTHYLDDNWVPILEKDVDGPNSLPLALDRQNPNLGRYSACRRVTRTIYLGSAPTLRAANRGLEDRRIKLGCVQPGESPAIFGDALRRLTDQATYLYVDASNRYWISTQPNVTRTAQDRATQFQDDRDKVWEEIIKRLRSDKQKGDFAGVHIAPDSSADIPDESSMGVRLVVLHPQYSHTTKAHDSDARQQVETILNSRGASPRYYKNLLTFLVPDKTQMAQLEQTVCQFLAWDSIVKDEKNLNLDPAQKGQAEIKKKSTDEAINQLLISVYQWVLVPEQPDPQEAIQWKELRLQGQDSPILRASRKLIHEEYLITDYAPSRLCMEILNPYMWGESSHIDIKRLWESIAQYIYLPRLTNDQVLLEAIQSGSSGLLWEENYAYATGWDEGRQRYLGLQAGTKEPFTVVLGSQNFIVNTVAAQQQLQADELAHQATNVTVPASQLSLRAKETVSSVSGSSGAISQPNPIPLPQKKHFYGSVEIDALRLRGETGQITDEILQHFTAIVGADVTITLDIRVNLPEGASDSLVRTITENCRVLKFQNHCFEES
jgi:predicted AAA+ superfamily ATPase